MTKCRITIKNRADLSFKIVARLAVCQAPENRIMGVLALIETGRIINGWPIRVLLDNMMY